MSTYTFLFICIQACLIQTVFSQCGCSGPIITSGISPAALGLGAAGLGYGAGLGYSSGLGYGFGLGCGAGLKGLSVAYGGVGSGDVVVAGELGVGGNTIVTGQVPALGAVSFGGNVPAGGAVTISGNCGYPCSCGVY